MAQKPNSTPADKHARDLQEAEKLDLEMRARLEAGLIDTSSGFDPVSASQPAPPVGHQKAESPSFWQAIKARFK